MQLAPGSEADQELVFSQLRQNTKQRSKRLSYSAGSAANEHLVVLKGFVCFLDKLHLSLAHFIASGNPLVIRRFGFGHRFYCCNPSSGDVGCRDDSGAQECSAVTAEMALVKLFNGMFFSAFSANVDSGQLALVS